MGKQSATGQLTFYALVTWTSCTNWNRNRFMSFLNITFTSLVTDEHMEKPKDALTHGRTNSEQLTHHKWSRSSWESLLSVVSRSSDQQTCRWWHQKLGWGRWWWRWRRTTGRKWREQRTEAPDIETNDTIITDSHRPQYTQQQQLQLTYQQTD